MGELIQECEYNLDRALLLLKKNQCQSYLLLDANIAIMANNAFAQVRFLGKDGLARVTHVLVTSRLDD